MKKLLALLLALAMVFALTACGSSATTTDTAAEAPAEDDAAAAEAAAEADAFDEAEEAGAACGEIGACGEMDACGEMGSSLPAFDASAYAADGDLADILAKGTLVVGITDFEPMDYQDVNGNWIGFDADMAALFAQYLGVEVEFVEIDWDNKIMELNAGTIDCVWNGMTLTDEVTSSMSCSNAYCNNAQVAIVPADSADQYQTVESLADLVFAVEAGSAGEAEVTALGYATNPVQSQAAALMEVAAGTSDAAVIDALMAAAMVGEGTSYADLTYTVGLNSEEYGVGFRSDSDMAQVLNDFFSACYINGTMQAIAESYGVQAALIAQ